jgi:hypothetical protein
MSAIPKVRSKEKEMLSLENRSTMLTKKLPIKNIFSKESANLLTTRSAIKAGLVFFATVGSYYLAKTTGIFSYFKWRAKNSNSKDASSTEIVEEKNALRGRKSLETAKLVNNPSVNRITPTYKKKNVIVEFKETKIEGLRDFSNVNKENVDMRKSSFRRSISIQNPIPDQNVFVNRPFNLTIDGAYVFSSNNSIFIEALNIPAWLTSYCSPTFKSSYDMLDDIHDIAVSENYAYVTSGSSLQIINITNSSNPTFKGSYNTPGDAYKIDLSENYAYVVNQYEHSSSLQIIDVSNLTNPTFKGSYDILDYIEGIVVVGNFTYVGVQGEYYNSLQIIDISNLTNPTFKSSYDIPGIPFEVTLSGNYAYVADDTSLQIIDVSDPSNPTFKGSYDMPSARGIAISSNYAYMAGEGLQIIDISDPANPIFKGSYDMPYAGGVAISSNYAYMAGEGLQIIDISDPSNPTFKGSYNTPDEDVSWVAVSGNYAYVTTTLDHLQIIIMDPKK